MIMPNDLPKEALEDPFRPPLVPCAVRCLHCNMEYSSSEIAWRSNPDGGGFWCCPTDGCGGMGFNFDIFPLDSDLWEQDDEDEDEDDIEIEPEEDLLDVEAEDNDEDDDEFDDGLHPGGNN